MHILLRSSWRRAPDQRSPGLGQVVLYNMRAIMGFSDLPQVIEGKYPRIATRPLCQEHDINLIGYMNSVLLFTS